MPETENRITVTDIQIPFWRLVAFLLKVALAAIPASILFAIILGIIFTLIRLVGFGVVMSNMRL